MGIGDEGTGNIRLSCIGLCESDHQTVASDVWRHLFRFFDAATCLTGIDVVQWSPRLKFTRSEISKDI